RTRRPRTRRRPSRSVTRAAAQPAGARDGPRPPRSTAGTAAAAVDRRHLGVPLLRRKPPGARLAEPRVDGVGFPFPPDDGNRVRVNVAARLTCFGGSPTIDPDGQIAQLVERQTENL